MIPAKLVTIEQLAEELQKDQCNISARTLRSLWHARKIPAVSLGRRTLRFDPEKVRAALDRFEVNAVA